MRTPFFLALTGITFGLWIHILFIAVGLFFTFDFRARVCEYKRVRQRLIEGSDDLDDLIERKQQTRCQRELTVTAAKVIGRKEYVQERFHTMGYRWYHFLPTWMFKEPQKMLTLTWWATFVGIKNEKT